MYWRLFAVRLGQGHYGDPELVLVEQQELVALPVGLVVQEVLEVNLNDMVLLSVLEKYHHYAYLFHKELQEEVKRKNFILNKCTQILLATIIKENNRKLL